MRIEWLYSAVCDLQRLRDFILPHNVEAARRAVRTIRAAVSPLAATPRLGKPVEDLPDYHDLIIPFGASGYVLRYRIQGDTVYVVAVKHGKEAGFSGQVPAAWLVNEQVDTAYGMVADGGPPLAENLLEERSRDNKRDLLKETRIVLPPPSPLLNQEGEPFSALPKLPSTPPPWIRRGSGGGSTGSEGCWTGSGGGWAGSDGGSTEVVTRQVHAPQ